MRDAFTKMQVLWDTLLIARMGLATGDNNSSYAYGMRFAWKNIGFGYSQSLKNITGKKWFPIIKVEISENGMETMIIVVNWENDGE